MKVYTTNYLECNPTILRYVPRPPRPTYLAGIELRTSTPTTYVAQRLAARTCLEAPFITFRGSIHIIFLTYALFLHRFLVSLHHQTTKVYGKEPFKQVRVVDRKKSKWFRDEMAEIAKNMWNKYEND